MLNYLKTPLILIFALALGGAPSLLAQAPDAATAYSRGIHLFFDGRYDEAAEWFDTAGAIESENPAYVYFRGLCDTRRGDTHGAENYYRHAADLEQTPKGRLVAVPRHLIRIQGGERQQLETIRREQIAVRQAEEKERQRRVYGETLDRQKEILTQPRVTPTMVPSDSAAKTAPANLPSVTPIQPVARPEANGAISDDLAQYEKEKEILYLKEEQGQTSLSTAAQRRRDARERAKRYATPADRPAADGSAFVDIYSTEEVRADGKPFVDLTAPTPAPPKGSAMGGGGMVSSGMALDIPGMMMGMMKQPEPESAEAAAKKVQTTTQQLFGDTDPANPFAPAKK